MAETDSFQKPIRLYLAARRSYVIILALVACAALVAAFGTSTAAMPTAAAKVPPVPFYRMLAMASAVLPVLALHSRLSGLETMMTPRLRSAQLRYLATLVAVSVVVYLGACAFRLPAPSLVIVARAWVAWFGLALSGGVVLGWRLAWVLPAFTSAVLWYWGPLANGVYRWWDFSARPPYDIASATLALAILTLGLIVYRATPWRRQVIVLGIRRLFGG